MPDLPQLFIATLWFLSEYLPNGMLYDECIGNSYIMIMWLEPNVLPCRIPSWPYCDICMCVSQIKDNNRYVEVCNLWLLYPPYEVRTGDTMV